MSEADNTGGNPGAGTAPTQETQVPKWRLDEVLARLRSREEELDIKNQLLHQAAPRTQQQQAPGFTAEDLGLEPQTFQAVQKLASHMVQNHVGQAGAKIQGQLASVANQLEETQFLLNHGKDKMNYLDRIKAERQRHYQTTGTYISVENAYKLVMFDELTRQTASRGNPAPAQQALVQTQAAGSGAPDTNQTRQGMAGSVPATGKTFTEMTIEEREAYLDAQLGGGTI